MVAHSKSKAGQGAALAAPPGLATSLEHSQNVVIGSRQKRREFHLVKCGCDCWFCEPCARRKGYNLRARLIPVLNTFTGLMMLTFTIDPSLFSSPREAYQYVREVRGISRAMRDLHRRGFTFSPRYFYVVEFQKHTEQAHFHVLVDASYIPKGELDELWSRLRPQRCGPPVVGRPPFGTTRFSVPRFDGGPAHAGRYVTKYLTELPSHGYPAWVMDMGAESRVPRYQSSRPFWGDPPRNSRPTGNTRKMHPRPYHEQVKGCGSTSNLFERKEHFDAQTGVVTVELVWLGRVTAGIERMEPLHAEGRFATRVVLPAKAPLDAIRMVEQISGFSISVVSGSRMGRDAA